METVTLDRELRMLRDGTLSGKELDDFCRPFGLVRRSATDDSTLESDASFLFRARTYILSRGQ